MIAKSLLLSLLTANTVLASFSDIFGTVSDACKTCLTSVYSACGTEGTQKFADCFCNVKTDAVISCAETSCSADRGLANYPDWCWLHYEDLQLAVCAEPTPDFTVVAASLVSSVCESISAAATGETSSSAGSSSTEATATITSKATTGSGPKPTRAPSSTTKSTGGSTGLKVDFGGLEIFALLLLGYLV
jgi:hypothetical protein